jgi:hypothetical protein
MAKRFAVGLGGKVKVFRTKRGYHSVSPDVLSVHAGTPLLCTRRYTAYYGYNGCSGYNAPLPIH